MFNIIFYPCKYQRHRFNHCSNVVWAWMHIFSKTDVTLIWSYGTYCCNFVFLDVFSMRKHQFGHGCRFSSKQKLLQQYCLENVDAITVCCFRWLLILCSFCHPPPQIISSSSTSWMQSTMRLCGRSSKVCLTYDVKSFRLDKHSYGFK